MQALARLSPARIRIDSAMAQHADDQQSTAASLPPGPTGRSRFFGIRDFFDFVDTRITMSRVGRLFHLAGSGHVRQATETFSAGDFLLTPSSQKRFLRLHFSRK